jgi:hypothetical protein
MSPTDLLCSDFSTGRFAHSTATDRRFGEAGVLWFPINACLPTPLWPVIGHNGPGTGCQGHFAFSGAVPTAGNAARWKHGGHHGDHRRLRNRTHTADSFLFHRVGESHHEHEYRLTSKRIELLKIVPAVEGRGDPEKDAKRFGGRSFRGSKEVPGPTFHQDLAG